MLVKSVFEFVRLEGFVQKVWYNFYDRDKGGVVL